MQIIKVISENNCNIFEKTVQKFLNMGFKLNNSFCGLEHFCDGSTDSSYKAILIKENV